MSKRQIIQSINGISIPPRKKFSPTKALPIRIIIPGGIPSMKNNYVPDANRKKQLSIIKKCTDGKISHQEAFTLLLQVKPFIRRSNRYMAWEEKIRPYILDQFTKWHQSYSKHGLSYPITKCSISVYHYWKDDRRRDNSNKREGLCDLFKKMNLITDDSFQCLRKDGGEADLYQDEITDHITVINLTAYEW